MRSSTTALPRSSASSLAVGITTTISRLPATFCATDSSSTPLISPPFVDRLPFETSDVDLSCSLFPPHCTSALHHESGRRSLGGEPRDNATTSHVTVQEHMNKGGAPQGCWMCSGFGPLSCFRNLRNGKGRRNPSKGSARTLSKLALPAAMFKQELMGSPRTRRTGNGQWRWSASVDQTHGHPLLNCLPSLLICCRCVGYCCRLRFELHCRLRFVGFCCQNDDVLVHQLSRRRLHQ